MSKSTFNASKSNFGVKGWALVLYIMVVYFANCLVGNGWQIAAGFWEEMHGWDSTMIVSCNSYGQFISVITAFIIGRLLVKKVKAKTLSIIFGFLSVISLILVSYAPSFGVACVLVIIASLAVNNWAYCINPVFVANWFPRKKGLVMGWATIGIPAGAGLSAKILLFVAERGGISMGMTVIAMVALLATVTAIFYVTDEPEQRGFYPDNDTSMTRQDAMKLQEEEKRLSENSPWTTRRILTTKELWMLAIPIGCEQLLSSGSMSTMVMKLTSLGYSSQTGVNMILFAAALACPSSFIMGYVDSKIGPKRANQICLVFCFLSCIFSLVGTFPFLIISTVLLGIVVGGAANFATSLCVEYWGRANFKQVYGIFNPVCFLVGSFGAAFSVQVAAHFGGFNATSIALAVMSILALIVFSLVKNDFVQKREASFSGGHA